MLVLLVLVSAVIIETTQEDFRDGIFSRNIYASRRNGGAIEFTTRFDLNNDGYLDVVSGNSEHYVFWGGAQGFSSDRITSYPSMRGNNIGADLNCDGYPELITAGFGSGVIKIYWGTATGPDPSNSTELVCNTATVECVYVSDLNKDGYLDIITESFSYDTAAIFWGDVNGYSISNRSLLPTLHAQHNLEIADLNKDGWLDIVIPNDGGTVNYIYWGTASGYNTAHRTSLPTPGGTPHGLSVADLNNDGWLDLVFTQFNGSESYIYWGSEGGYNLNNRTVLNTGSCHGGSSIADFNKDGFLDILFYRGKWDYTRVRSVIYWGSSQGFDDGSYSEIGLSINASGGLVADFNFDGELDIFVNNLIGEDYDFVFYGPSFSICDSLSIIHSDLHGMYYEIGNVYTRKYEEEYISSIIGSDSLKVWKRISWTGVIPDGASIEMYIRIGESDTLDSTWSTWQKVYNDSLLDLGKSKYLQYKALFKYTNPAYLPLLEEVRIYFSESQIALFPSQQDSVLPGQEINYLFFIENNTLSSHVVDLQIQNSNPSFNTQLMDSSGDDVLRDFNNDGYQDVGLIDTGEIVSFTLKLTAPPSALYGQCDTVILRAFCADDTTIYDTAFAVTVVQKYVAIDVSPDTLDSLEAAASILISLRGTNLGNVTDVMDITASQTNFRWQFSLYDSTGLNLLQDTDGDGVSDLGVQLPLVSKSFYLLIRSPSTAVPQEVDTIIVKGHSSQDPNVVDSAIIVLKIKGPKIIEVEPDTSGFIYPGDSVDYKLRCWNYDSLDHLIEVKKGLGIFNVEFLDTLLNPLPDADGDGYPEIGPVIPQTFKTFVVRVLCPSTQTPGSVDTMLIYGFSNSDTTLGDYATVITTVRNPYGVELYPDAVDSCGPGEEVIYSVHVRNTGVREDTIEIYPVSQHSGFTCVISGPQDMDSDGRQEVYLNPGEDSIFQVRVYAADSVFPGVSDTLRIYGHSQLSPTTGDYVTLITTIIPRNISIDIYPDRYVSTPPGGTMDVFFTVETRGSIQDLIEFPVSGGGPEWFVTIEDSSGIPLQDSDNNGIVEIGPVAGGENVKIRVKVTAPDRYDSTRYCITARFHTFPYIKDSASLLVEVIPPLDFHNSPNPFRKKTTFILSVPDEGRLFLAIYTRTGERIEVIFDGKVDRGITKVEWEPKKLKPGTYPVLFRYESNGETRKMIKKLVKLP